jgi:hypothetical protein
VTSDNAAGMGRWRAGWLSARMALFALRHRHHPGYRKTEDAGLYGFVCFADGGGIGMVADGREWVVARGKPFVMASVEAARGPWNPIPPIP